MKTIRFAPQFAAAVIAGFLSAPSVQAVQDTWNATTDGNWSAGLNWDQGFAPGSADDASFLNAGAGTVNTVDVSTTINSLNYGQDNQLSQTTTISPGQSLTISGSAANLMYVGSTSASITASTLTPVTIQGTGGALNLSGTGDLVVRQGFSSNGSHMATLDLSGLDTLNANIGRLLVGQANPGNAVNRPSGTLILARTNYITLTGASPQVMIQDAGQNSNSGTTVLTFGQETHLFGDVMRLGGQKGSASLNFNTSFTNPSLQIRNADGASPVSAIDFGYNGAVSSGNGTTMTADFSLGTVDVLANLVNIAQGNPGPSTGTCVGTLTIGAGVFAVNNLEIGYGNATGAGGATTGTMNVNNNFLFSTGAVLVVNNSLRLARSNGGAGVVSGTLNVNNGTVVANSIVDGGGVSTISVVTGGTLVVSNAIGSIAAPIDNFIVGDSTLQVSTANGVLPVVVNNLTAGGSQNVINVSAFPPVGSYPATFNLISYQAGSGGNFVLGSLPAGSPSYAGSIVDLGNGVISVELTAGPIADVTETWTGANGGDWDTTTYNWLFHATATNFFNGAVVVFDDTATASDINLAQSLSPGLVTVNNSTLNYSFIGIGNIAGSSGLVKNGSGRLSVANSGVDNFGTVVINGGVLQIGMGDVDGGISALGITNNGALEINRSGSLTLNSPISGSGTITKNGDGTLVLSGANTYNGTTLLNQGALQVDQTSSGAGSLSTSTGTILAGGGIVNGAVMVGGLLDPGSAAARGTFKAHGGLTLAAGSTLNFDLSANDPFNLAANDSIEVVGNLNANNNVINVNIAGTPQNGASYLLFTYTGTLSGNFNPVITGTHFPVTLDTSTPGYVYLNITGASGFALEWNSTSDSSWDSVTANWLNLAGSTPATFSAGDSVLFDDTPGVVTTVTIGAGIAVFPSAITNASDNNSFTINGAGKISGTTGIVKTNSSLLIIATANDFTGPVDVQAGILQTANDAALGAPTAGTTVEAGATLDLNGQNLGGEILTVSGGGANSLGAIINNGPAQFQAVRQVVLAGDATFGGTGTWQINNGGGAASLSTGGNPYNLTKVGPNQVTLAQLATVDTALADIDIQAGILEFSGLTPGMGDPARTNTVEPGATLSFANGTVVWNKYFIFQGDGVTTTVNVGTGGNAELASPVELHGSCLFNVGGTSLTISGPVSGDGGLTKNGGSPLILAGANTYTGDTFINSAALRLSGNSDISSSPNITLSAGATLTVTGRVDVAFTLVSGQSLKGNGVISGSLIEGAGSTISPGIGAIGALTVSNTISLSGTTMMELDEANATNDVLATKSSITYGGTLNLVNLGGSLSSGSSFKLFKAGSYLGSFGSITPATPGPGQTWDTSQLATTGTIKVTGGGGTSPQFGGTVVSGTNVIFSGTGGPAAGIYYVLATTNVALPRSSWTPVATNMFDANGNFTFTNILSPAVPKQFFQLQVP